MNGSAAYRWVILAVCSYIAVCYGFVFQSIPPLLASLLRDLSISFAQAGALMGSFALPAIFVAAPLGLLVDGIGIRRTGRLTLAAFALGACVLAFGGGYPMYVAGRIICGIGGAALLVFAPRAVAEWFGGREMGLAMGVFNMAVPLGTILALMGLGLVAETFGWPQALVLSAAVAVSAFAAFALLYRERDTAAVREQVIGGAQVLSMVTNSGGAIWLLGLVWMFFGAGYFQYFTFASEYFIAHGSSVESAGLYASGPMWIGMIFAPVVGILLDRWQREWLFILAGCVGVAAFTVLLPLHPVLIVPAIFFIGASAAAIATPVFALPPLLMPARALGFGYGILTASFGLGAFGGAVSLGFIRDVSGRGDSVFFGMAAFMIIAVLPTLVIRGRVAAART